MPSMEGYDFQKAERKIAFAVHICTHLYTLQPKKIPNCNRVPRSPRYDSKTYIMVPKRTNLGPKQMLWLQNSSREDPPEYASAAWDHWTGRDCATGRPSRSLCLDLTSGPPLDAPASHSHPTPLSMDTDGRTAPCLNARGCGIYKGRGPAQEVPLPQRHPATGTIAP